MLRRLFKWLAIGIPSLLLLAFVILAIVGFPKPPTITKEGIGRVGWTPILENFSDLRRSLKSRSLGVWLPDGKSMTMTAPHNVVDFRLHIINGPGESPAFQPQFPRAISGFYTEPGVPYAITRWGEGGAENYELYRWDVGSSDPVQLTSGNERAVFGAFKPGAGRIAYVSTRRNNADYDIYIMDPEDPETDNLVLEREGSWSVADWSPTNEELLLVKTYSNVHNELYIFDIESGTVESLSQEGSDSAVHRSVQYALDGAYLFYSSDLGTEFRHLRRLQIETGTETILSAEIPWDISSIQQSGDGSLLVMGANEDGRTRYYRYDIESGTTAPLEIPLEGIYSVLLHPQELVLRVNHTDPVGLTRGYLYDLGSETLTLWAGPDPKPAEFPAPRLVRYPTFDMDGGAPREISAFVYPGTGDGPRPVMIEIHGGPESQSRLSTGYGMFQKQGITVIAPNVRGSTGYGKSFTNLDNGFLRENSVKDIGALLDWISDEQDMDARRVMVNGGSYGGYMVLASLMHFGDRLRCGIDVVGISNFVTFLENTADYRRDLRRAEYGDERDPEMRAFLESISPLNHVEAIRSRIMLIQGANDPRVPVTESRQFVEQMRDNGQDVAYIEASDEGHGFRNPWNSIYTGVAQFEMARECLLESGGS